MAKRGAEGITLVPAVDAALIAELDALIPDEVMGDWSEQGLCGQTDPEIFFPKNNDNGGTIQEAKQVCMRCEVREMCLEYALATGEEHGIRGGLTRMERRDLRRQRAGRLAIAS